MERLFRAPPQVFQTKSYDGGEAFRFAKYIFIINRHQKY